jgi:putative Ca2+/H+ antiporter (TMEM165/GDT1 family)
MISLFLMAYGVILLTEMLGDKTLYTAGTLVMRYRPAPVLCGAAVAFMGKMLAAVLLSQAIADLPAPLVAGLSAAVLFALALLTWLRKPEEQPAVRAESQGWFRTAAISFGAIFFTEWGDVGQITAATLAVRYRAPATIWLAATLALVTKSVLAISLGVFVRGRVPLRTLRYVALCMYLAMGILSALRLDL